MKTTIPHRPGVDGLRALAVTAVLLYHADITWMPGGFLGVDVFFAISGYLITSLLVAELGARGVPRNAAARCAPTPRARPAAAT